MIKPAAGARGQFCLSQISDGVALLAPLDEFGSIPHAAQFHLSAAVAIPLVRTLHYFSGVAQNCADGPDGSTHRHCFCTAMKMEIALRVTKVLVAELTVRKRNSQLDELIMAALLLFDRSLMQSSRLSPFVGEVLERKYR